MTSSAFPQRGTDVRFVREAVPRQEGPVQLVYLLCLLVLMLWFSWRFLGLDRLWARLVTRLRGWR